LAAVGGLLRLGVDLRGGLKLAVSLIIKSGHFDATSEQRFEVERQSLVVMDHFESDRIFLLTTRQLKPSSLRSMLAPQPEDGSLLLKQ
jgi:hypothetical protein